jgi:hypothetical protein
VRIALGQANDAQSAHDQTGSTAHGTAAKGGSDVRSVPGLIVINMSPDHVLIVLLLLFGGKKLHGEIDGLGWEVD